MARFDLDGSPDYFHHQQIVVVVLDVTVREGENLKSMEGDSKSSLNNRIDPCAHKSTSGTAFPHDARPLTTSAITKLCLLQQS